MKKIFKILVCVCVAVLLVYTASRLFKNRQNRVGSKETGSALKTFTLAEFLFPTNDVPETATAQSAVGSLLMEQIKYCLSSSSSKNAGQLAAETFQAVDAAIVMWPPSNAEALLAQLAAGLTGSADKDAERVAQALMAAASTEQRPPVMAAIALAVADREACDAVIQAGVNAAPSAERKALRKIAAAPMQQLKKGADVDVLRIVKAFHLLRSHWNQTGKPAALLQDSDGGEPPASRR